MHIKSTMSKINITKTSHRSLYKFEEKKLIHFKLYGRVNRIEKNCEERSKVR